MILGFCGLFACLFLVALYESGRFPFLALGAVPLTLGIIHGRSAKQRPGEFARQG
jgi:hypothetical protein